MTVDIPATLRELLEDEEGVDVALLFGSRARKTARATSDVDVAYLGCADPVALTERLTDALRLDVHLVDLARAGVPLLDEVLRDGIVVHEGAPGAGAAWRSRALLQLEVDRPWYHRMRDAWLARVAKEGL